MKKYITLFLGYGFGLHIFTYFLILGFSYIIGLLTLLLSLIKGMLTENNYYTFSYNNYSQLSVIDNIFNIIIIIIMLIGIYFALKIVSNWAFKTYIKEKYFNKETFSKDLILITIFMSIIPILISFLNYYEKSTYIGFIGTFIYIILFYVINYLLGKKLLK